MKKLKAVIIAALSVFVLAGCGGNGETKDTGSSSANSESALEKIKEKGTLVVGTSADFAPFEFKTLVDGKDTIVGSDIDMVKAIGEKLGVEVEFMDMQFDAVLVALQQNKVDIAVSGISATEERKKTFDFSTPYYNPPQKIVINKNNKDIFTSIDSLNGKKVGAQKGSIQEGVVEAQLPDTQKVSIPRVPNLIVELNQGSIDALVLEETIAESYINQNPDLMMADIELTSNEDEAFAIAFSKGQDDLKKEIDVILEKMIADGSIDQYVKAAMELSDKSSEE
ncbi:transporter substrate-binding domain-containing protein [Enterococcus sp. BWB1-3]|uniref:transporter substrate-binding domain-containing protein n=1 Tax=unclassified Enterococcus TaxID=2608891 RepID=UPI001921BF73|nr:MULTISPECIES: transporter substrate-binding domain-containing protein [unclassified Enterococcus]MBL1230842.1 transporter substrate-binding domain-containing protein [Enterococcus sp. BWB1-3]MCB5952177.1 transporter substrate-binding domain-containing protein [Enterococcus sp. BWT-B8]MCB5956016.1 transporter substrate-binding domain-containing protein [Enterococcus sp. CWB-B31]